MQSGVITPGEGMMKGKGSFSSIVLFIISVMLIWNVFNYKAWNRSRIIYSDTFSYYAYLPALFIEKDIKLQ